MRTPAWRKKMTADQASDWLGKHISPFTSGYDWKDYIEFDSKCSCYRLKHNPAEYNGHVIRFENKGDPIEVKWWKREREEQIALENQNNMEGAIFA